MNTTAVQAPVADREAPVSSIVRLQGISRIYGGSDTQVRALDDVNVGFGTSESTAIMGPSGSSKSMAMHILTGLDASTSEHVFVEDTNTTALKDTALTRLRRDCIGFVFRSLNLVPTLDVCTNIFLPMRLADATPEKGWFDLIINSPSIEDRLSHRPSEMSGGQWQRVAVTRVLVNRPAVIATDEPTGNLDSHPTTEVMDPLRHAVDELGQSVIMATHDTSIAVCAGRVLAYRDGRIISDLCDVTVDSLTAVLHWARVYFPGLISRPQQTPS